MYANESHLYIIRVIVHSPKDIPADVFLLVDSDKAQAAQIYALKRQGSQQIAIGGLFCKTWIVAHNMPIGIDIFSTVQQFPEIRVLFIQTSRCDPADIEGMLILAEEASSKL